MNDLTAPFLRSVDLYALPGHCPTQALGHYLLLAGWRWPHAADYNALTFVASTA